MNQIDALSVMVHFPDVDLKELSTLTQDVVAQARGGVLVCRVVVGWIITVQCTGRNWSIRCSPLRRPAPAELPDQVALVVSVIAVEAGGEIDQVVRGSTYNPTKAEVCMAWTSPEEH